MRIEILAAIGLRELVEYLGYKTLDLAGNPIGENDKSSCFEIVTPLTDVTVVERIERFLWVKICKRTWISRSVFAEVNLQEDPIFPVVINVFGYRYMKIIEYIMNQIEEKTKLKVYAVLVEKEPQNRINEEKESYW